MGKSTKKKGECHPTKGLKKGSLLKKSDFTMKKSAQNSEFIKKKRAQKIIFTQKSC